MGIIKMLNAVWCLGIRIVDIDLKLICVYYFQSNGTIYDGSISFFHIENHHLQSVTYTQYTSHISIKTSNMWTAQMLKYFVYILNHSNESISNYSKWNDITIRIDFQSICWKVWMSQFTIFPNNKTRRNKKKPT